MYFLHEYQNKALKAKVPKRLKANGILVHIKPTTSVPAAYNLSYIYKVWVAYLVSWIIRLFLEPLSLTETENNHDNDSYFHIYKLCTKGNVTCLSLLNDLS